MVEVRRSSIRVPAERNVCCEKTDDMGGSDEGGEGWKRWLRRTGCGGAAHGESKKRRTWSRFLNSRLKLGSFFDGLMVFGFSFSFAWVGSIAFLMRAISRSI